MLLCFESLRLIPRDISSIPFVLPFVVLINQNTNVEEPLQDITQHSPHESHDFYRPFNMGYQAPPMYNESLYNMFPDLVDYPSYSEPCMPYHPYQQEIVYPQESGFPQVFRAPISSRFFFSMIFNQYNVLYDVIIVFNSDLYVKIDYT